MRIAGLRHTCACCLQIGLCALQRVGCALGTQLRFFQRSSSYAACTNAQARRCKLVALARNHHCLWVRKCRIHCISPRLNEYHSRQQHIQQAVDLCFVLAGLGAHAGAQADAVIDRWRRWHGGDGIQCKHRAHSAALAQFLQRPACCIHVARNHCRQRIAKGNLHRNTALGIYLDQFGKRANGTFHIA